MFTAIGPGSTRFVLYGSQRVVQFAGFTVYGSWFVVKGSRLVVQGSHVLWFRIHGLWCRVQSSRSGVQCTQFTVAGSRCLLDAGALAYLWGSQFTGAGVQGSGFAVDGRRDHATYRCPLLIRTPLLQNP